MKITPLSRRLGRLGLLALASLSLGACDAPPTGPASTAPTGTLKLDSDEPGAKGFYQPHGLWVIQTPGQPDASIDAQGRVRIGQQALPLSPAQQHLFQQFYAGNQQLVDAGLHMTGSGPLVGLEITRGVWRQLAEGNQDQATLEASIQPALRGLSQGIAAICDKLAAQQVLQDKIVAQLPRWRDYALINANQIQQCRQGAQQALHAIDKD